MSNIKAVPTQYKGILFDSKSEAIFARSLDLINESFTPSDGASRTHWTYHPTSFKINGYCPDFSFIWMDTSTPVPSLNDTGFISLAEYKPTKPTDAYINRIIEYFKNINRIDRFRLVGGMEIYYGNTFNGTQLCKILLHQQNEQGDIEVIHDEDMEFETDFLYKAAKYRFDLDPLSVKYVGYSPRKN